MRITNDAKQARRAASWRRPVGCSPGMASTARPSADLARGGRHRRRHSVQLFPTKEGIALALTAEALAGADSKPSGEATKRSKKPLRLPRRLVCRALKPLRGMSSAPVLEGALEPAGASSAAPEGESSAPTTSRRSVEILARHGQADPSFWPCTCTGRVHRSAGLLARTTPRRIRGHPGPSSTRP